MRVLKAFIIFLIFCSLAGCGLFNQGVHIFHHESPEETNLGELLRKAERCFHGGQYERAYQYYEQVRNLYPGSPQAIYAHLKMADSKFWEGKYLEAVALYEEFEKFYPANEAIPYVIFQIGTCYYKMRKSYDRDQSFTKKAIEAYQRLLETYPNSPYTTEVKNRIKKLRELLAKHELYVAQFYYKIGYYRAAYGRLLYLINNYPETSPAVKARKLVLTYYKKAVKETEELKNGTKKDFWGEPVP